MAMQVMLKETDSAEPFTIGYEEFKQRIQRGELGPKHLICDRVLTDGQWWPLDELNIFHNHASTRYPLGPNLQKKRYSLARCREAKERSSGQIAAYMDGDLIEERYALAPLRDLVRKPGVLGVTRLYVLPSFRPECIFDFVFGVKIQIAAAQGRTALWYSVPQVTLSGGTWEVAAGTPFDPKAIERAESEIAYTA